MPGDRVRLQNIRTNDFNLTGTVESQRLADDGKIVSYNIQTDKGYATTRHKRLLRPHVTDDPITDPDIPKQCVNQDGEVTTEQSLPNTADTREQPADRKAGPRRSSRNIPVTLGSSSASVKRIKPKMGGNCSCEKKLASRKEITDQIIKGFFKPSKQDNENL